MGYYGAERFSLDTLCSSPSGGRAFIDGARCTSTAATTSAAWEENPFFALFVEGHIANERCQVWVTNLLLTLAVAAVVSLRIWWTCGNLPPSDSNYEPALGRVVVETSSQNDEGDVGEQDTFSPSAPLSPRSSFRSGRSSEGATKVFCAKRNKASMGSERACLSTASSSLCPCLSSYLPVDTTLLPASSSTAAEQHSDREARADVEVVHRFSRLVLPQLIWTHLWTTWDTISRHRPLHCLIERQRNVNARVLTFLHSCATMWRLLRAPFSAFPSLCLSLHSCGQPRSRQRIWPPQHGLFRTSTSGLSEREKWPLEQHDLSDEEEEEFRLEQEELWGLLEGIERRRRALTGRNLFRQPLPPRRQRRLSRARDPVPIVDEVPHDDLQLFDDAPDAVVIPTLAVGVPLRFSTDRRARPMLTDRRGRWVPVAVVDEEGEYYNYNLDQVLPQV